MLFHQATGIVPFSTFAQRHPGDARAKLHQADVVLVREGGEGGRIGCAFGWDLLCRFMAGDERFNGLEVFTIDYSARDLRAVCKLVAEVKGFCELDNQATNGFPIPGKLVA